MGKTPYSLARKITERLKAEGITATVSDDLTVTVGSYSERLAGIITADAIAALAERIKVAS